MLMTFLNKYYAYISGSCRRAALTPVFAFFLLLAAPPVIFAGTIDVNEVIVEGNSSISREELLYLLDITEGGSFDDDDITRGIKRLFRKGIFDSISVETLEGEGEGAGGRVLVRVKEKAVIDDVYFYGQKRLSSSFLKRWFPLKEGMVLEPDRLESARNVLEDALEKRGFPDSIAEINVVKTDDPYRVELEVEILEAVPQYIRLVEIIGRSDYPDHKLISKMRLRVNDIFDVFKLERDMERIESFLRSKGHIKPDIGPYTFIDGQLLLGVKPGVRLEVEITGNDSVADRAIRAAMPFSEAGEVTDGLVTEAVIRINELYTRKSFSETRIVPVLVGERDDLQLRFFIHEGIPQWVNEITIKSMAVPPEKLLEIMVLKERNPFGPRELKRDIGRITEFYLALGYRDVDVKEPLIAIVDKRVSILIEIEEGLLHRYSDITVSTEGNLSSEDISGELALAVGDPYNEVDITDARRSLQSACQGTGYFYCKVDVQRDFRDGGEVGLLFNVNEGDVFFFGKTIVKGNSRTRRPVITRQLQYLEGEPVDPSQLLQSRQMLLKLGLFRSVEITPRQSGENKMDLDLDVEEAPPGAVSFGFGYGEYELYRGFIDISYSNLFGMNRRGFFRTEHSTLWSRYMLNFQEPYLLGRELLSTTTLLYEKRKEKNIDSGDISYRIEKVSVSTGLEKDFTSRIKGLLSYSYSINRTSDVQPDVVLTRDDTGTLAISSITPGIIYDTRDNPFDPTRGFLASLRVKFASEALGSDPRFVKTTARTGVYFPVARRVIFAASVRGGTSRVFGETEDLPLVERFFLGGRNTVRGYGQDRLGPIGSDGNPIGGNAFAQGNVELRLKVTGNWRIVPFMDAGNVWIDPDDADTSDLKYTYGAGLQYNTPVGPVRLDYGRKMDPEKGESKEEIHFSIGHAF